MNKSSKFRYLEFSLGVISLSRSHAISKIALSRTFYPVPNNTAKLYIVKPHFENKSRIQIQVQPVILQRDFPWLGVGERGCSVIFGIGVDGCG